VETNDDGILRAAFSLFDIMKKSIHVHQLFYCTKRTTWMEIYAFIYRCFFSKDYQLLIRPDLLSLLIQDKFFPLLNQLIDEYPTHSLQLGFITTKSASHIQLINAIKTRINVNIVRDQELLSKDAFTSQIQNMFHQCTIVTSRLSGLGKSQFIEKESHRLGKQLIKFPIGGDIKADEIADRLQSLGSQSLRTSILHLDIGYVDDVHDLNELLYCLTIFRSFCFGQLAIHVPIETPIYIEIASSPFITINERLILCQHLKPVYLDRINWDDLSCDRPTIQFVAKYLNAIDAGGIANKNINMEDTEIIDRALCLKLIQNHFLQGKNLEFVTWTQLSIFIAVFYSLFNGFSICGYFLVESLTQPQLRLDILQALLRSSDQFTSVSVETVRKQQRTSLIDDPETHQPILTDSIVRWENTQPFTLVFTATHDPLFVYKTVLDVPQSLRNCFNDFQQAISQRSKRTVKNAAPNHTDDNVLLDYNKLTHVEFFQKLASLSHKYFNKAVCIKCFKQYPYNTQKCTQCNMDDSIHQPATLETSDIVVFQTKIATLLEAEYVLTPDNYVKMLLIYMRIQSGLPVLIMGETGKIF
jgi:ribosomal protein L40E